MSRHLFVAGAQRSGTTYLYQILHSHPEIEMNEPWWPEPKFFMTPDSENHVADYLKKYFSEKPVKVRGEKSASYIESNDAAARISRCFPDAKIIFILRDPIDRAISNYWYTAHHKHENKSVDEALTSEEAQERPYDRSRISVSPYSYLKRSNYVHYMDMYSEYFDKEQIKILVFEQFIENQKAVSSLFEFLGVDPDFVPPMLHEKVNEYGAPSEADAVNKDTELFLRNYFKEPNEQLSSKYGVDTSRWRSSLLCAPETV